MNRRRPGAMSAPELHQSIEELSTMCNRINMTSMHATFLIIPLTSYKNEDMTLKGAYIYDNIVFGMRVIAQVHRLIAGCRDNEGETGLAFQWGPLDIEKR